MAGIDHRVVVQHANSTKRFFEVQSECLTTVASQIANALNFKSVEARRCESLKADLVILDAKQDTLKKELEQLSIQREHLYNSILEIDENLVNKQNDISYLKEEHVAIAQTPMLTNVDVKTLETLQKVLKTQRDELVCLVWV